MNAIQSTSCHEKKKKWGMIIPLIVVGGILAHVLLFLGLFILLLLSKDSGNYQFYRNETDIVAIELVDLEFGYLSAEATNRQLTVTEQEYAEILVHTTVLASLNIDEDTLTQLKTLTYSEAIYYHPSIGGLSIRTTYADGSVEWASACHSAYMEKQTDGSYLRIYDNRCLNTEQLEKLLALYT